MLKEPKISKTEKAYIKIKNRIYSGILMPGDYLNENRIAGELKMNRSSIREALNQLLAEGLVEKRKNRRIYLTSINIMEKDKLMEFRAALESSAAWLAAEYRTKEDLKRLKQCIKDHRYFIEKKYWEAVNEADRRFHLYIVEASKNQYLIDSYNRGKIKLHIRFTNNFVQSEIAKTIPEHENILKALSDKKKSLASSLIWEHLRK